MITVAGIFTERAAAALAVQELRLLGMDKANVDLLTPGSTIEPFSQVPTADTEQAGMGRAVGSVVGGAVGVGSGLALGTAAASFLVPGIGPVLGLGALGAAILGLAGATGGGAIGNNMDRALLDGLPKDEIFLYEDALRQGRSVVICLTRDEIQRDEAQRIFEHEGAESIDAARQRWWAGLGDVEREHYVSLGRRSEGDQDAYRRGFESALNPEFRGRTWEQVNYILAERDSDWSNACFRAGFERGRRHYRALVDPHLAA